MLLPRPYQAEGLKRLNDHICTKDTNPCVVVPTGGGKSLMIAWSIEMWLRLCPWFRCVILAHRKELIVQNAEELLRVLHDDGFALEAGTVGIFSAALKRRDWDAQILFASIDSIYKKAGEFIPFDAIMVDEAHRIPPSGEGKYRTFLSECRKYNPEIRYIGWTATPYRMGCGPICHKDHLLQEVCYEAKVTDLINDGFLCGLRSKVGEVEIDTSNVKRNSGGDYVTVSLSKAVNKGDVVARAVREAVTLICREKRCHIVFFCVDVTHCHAVSAELSKYGIDAPAITGKTDAKVRTRVGEDFKSGKLHAVCNVNVYTEGFNATCVDCIVLLRPTLSAGLFSQMVGRGLRLHNGKRDCLVLDFAGCIDEHGPVDLLGGRETVMAICGQCRESFSRAVKKCPQCGWVIPPIEMERKEAVESEKRMHGENASTKSILSTAPSVHEVHDVFVGRHKKGGKPDSLLVRYLCGVEVFREWVCLDHEGYAGKRQCRLAVSAQYLRDWTKTISVKRNGKYKEVVGYNHKP